jgi:hypothetical protein
MVCITLDGKLITCSLEIIENMLLIPCVMPFFKGKNLAMPVLEKQNKIK